MSENAEAEIYPMPSPAMIIEARDETLGLLGYVVIDRPVAGMASGGVRFAPDVSPQELAALARSMTLKWAFLNIPMGGAKAGIVADPARLGCDRATLMHAFGRAIAPLVRGQVYFPGVDLGTTLDDLRVIMQGAGQPLPAEQIDGSVCTALTVFEALRQLVHSRGGDLNGLTIALEGFGKVASALALRLDQVGARLTAVSTINGTIINPQGFDVARLIELKSLHGDALVEHVEGGQPLPVSALLGQQADVLIPGARPWSIYEGNVDQIRARWIVPIGNAPVTPQAEAELTARGVVVVPDFVANCGGIYASALLGNGFDLDDGRAMIEGPFAQLLSALFEQSARSGRPIGEEARSLAWRRHTALCQPKAPSASRTARLRRLWQQEGSRGMWSRLAWRVHRIWPGLDGTVRTAAAHRMAQMTFVPTLYDLLGKNASAAPGQAIQA